jgi:L,D-peptidoglycan transpeptidase YkuD (ErfK/YbiS/YcfS/YnhG family)
MSRFTRQCILLCPLFLSVPSAISGERLPALKERIAELSSSSQLLLVLARDWNATKAKLYTFERDDAGDWKTAGIESDVVIGRKGLAWGIGLHGGCEHGSVCKKEGDERAPAGVFELDEIFGVAKAPKLRFPYRHITATTEAIDDPRSRFYNRFVDARRVQRKDWASSEHMLRSDDLYRWGIVVRHNWKQRSGRGSCIFLHTWLGPDQGTSGCTAMPSLVLQKLIRWIDQAKQPVLVQLPQIEYRQRKVSWQSPLVP